MDAIQSARQLGYAIQADERYIAFSLASQRCEEDKALQEAIAAFNQTRASLGAELQKGEAKDEAKVGELNNEMRELYQSVMQNENMAAMNSARNDMKQMLDFVNQIISGSSQGQNPDIIEYSENCGGDCSGCSGCN